MIVFVEGPDNCGKGTQINNMYKEFANDGEIPYWVHYANFGIKDKEACINFSDRAYEAMFNLAASQWYSGIDTIHDRAHLGEWVYGKKYRDYDAEFIWEIEQCYRDEHPNPFLESYLIVYVDKPENLIERDDGLSFSTDLSDKQWEIERFTDAWSRSIFENKIIIDISDKNQDEVWKITKDFLWHE